jgi:hypothetical protein
MPAFSSSNRCLCCLFRRVVRRYVVNKVLQPMESTDPFADDFYFLQVRDLHCGYALNTCRI